MRTTVLIIGLVLLLVANFLMMYSSPWGMVERFTDASGNVVTVPTAGTSMLTDAQKKQLEAAQAAAIQQAGAMQPGPMATNPPSAVTVMPPPLPMTGKTVDGFTSYNLSSGAGAKDAYKPIGSFDGIKLSTGNDSSWRYTSPNVPLRGPAFVPGPDSLFIFKNNQVKPECCGSSYSSDMGCVCTTPQQRKYITTRGGNRTVDDGV